MSTISDFKDKFSGERLFLIGNGPSLERTPLSKLESEYTIAMNKIARIYETTSWRPSFYFLALPPDHGEIPNDLNGDNYITENIHSGNPCFLHDGFAEHFRGIENVYHFSPFQLRRAGNPFHDASQSEIEGMDLDHLSEYWADDVTMFIYIYHSMYGVTQLAAYMGFDELYFVGCDLGFEYQNPHMIFERGLDPHRYDGNGSEYLSEALSKGVFLRSLANAVAMKTIENPVMNALLEGPLSHESAAHFTADYIDGLNITDRTVHDSEIRKAHSASKRILEDRGVELYNATVGGELEVYTRVDIESVVE